MDSNGKYTDTQEVMNAGGKIQVSFLNEHISNVTHLLLDFLFLPIKFSPRLYVNAIVGHLLSQWVEGKQKERHYQSRVFSS